VLPRAVLVAPSFLSLIPFPLFLIAMSHSRVLKAPDGVWAEYAQFLDSGSQSADRHLQCFLRPGETVLLSSPVIQTLRCKYAAAFPGKPRLSACALLDQFLSWAGRRRTQYPHLGKALDQRKTLRAQHHQLKRALAAELGIGASTEAGEARLKKFDSAPVIRVKKLASPYPPPNFFIAETKQILGKWDKHLKERKMPDSRTHRQPAILLDESKLQYELPENESAIFVDDDTGTKHSSYMKSHAFSCRCSCRIRVPQLVWR